MYISDHLVNTPDERNTIADNKVIIFFAPCKFYGITGEFYNLPFFKFEITIDPVMKKITLALLAVVFMIYLGFYGMEHQSSSGPFFMFIGVCTAIGLTLDIVNMVKEKIRRSRISKLG
jgi:hypothetical protein